MALNNEPILPQWLSMIQHSGICQKCNSPEGNSYIYSLNNQHDASNLIGFYICSKQDCKTYMSNYIDMIFFNLYTSQKWNRIMHTLVNRSYIKVLRSNGNIDYDWKIYFSSYSDNDANLEMLNKYPLNDNFISAILCAYNKFDFYIPSVIWENIFNMTIELYSKHVHLIFGLNLETYIMVYKENIDLNLRICKLIDLDTLVDSC